MRDCEGYSTERLHAELSRLREQLHQARYDTFTVCLLTGQMKMVEREIEKRHHAAATAGRI